ncbi:hypothetical protein AEQ18_00530 [Enterococcus sp. RIT-PI-f]|nr:hypothetical protein AEQ18_00530 [Enterococcus sp. RIT-PI-f]
MEKSQKPYRVFWSNKNLATSQFEFVGEVNEPYFTLYKSTHVPHYFKISGTDWESPVYESPVFHHFNEQIETLDRGLIAVPIDEGIFLSWRLLFTEVIGYDKMQQSLTSLPFTLYRNDVEIAVIENSTNYLDPHGKPSDTYRVAYEANHSKSVSVWANNYFDVPIKKPKSSVTPNGKLYHYQANDLSVMDADGDGEYELILKWEPSNAQDVSQKGYTGNCYIDCYKLSGKLVWRIDCGPNIRSGAHYTQFMCFDFNSDGKGEINIKTAPGTKIIRFDDHGDVIDEVFITLPTSDRASGITHQDNYVCSSEDYANHLHRLFMKWHRQPEVLRGQWPQTIEDCLHLKPRYNYPLSSNDAQLLVDYFIDEFAPSKSEKNQLRNFEGFIFDGPEYLTMFSGDGKEIQTIPFPFPRDDDGLRWGDYAGKRIEPCNRVDRFLSGVGYLDGERPYLIICRGYYTRTCIAAYHFINNAFEEVWKIDSGHIPMDNPFDNHSTEVNGTDPQYGTLAGQGNHSLSCVDIDGDGCMEIIYGGAAIDHDGRLLYSSWDKLPSGQLAKLGHGDAMHVADIDPDRPGFEIFNVFEGASAAPYGYALRKAENGNVIFGEYEEARDLGRCMIGDVLPQRGLQCWVNTIGTFDCHGRLLEEKTLGTNMSIRYRPDFTTQVIDGTDYLTEKGSGVINDFRQGTVLIPNDTKTNNGTKGNPALVVDLFGDYREELIVRKSDSSALRIYTNTEKSNQKLFTLMHDTQYRTGIAWQNNCYNQPCYPKFYYASDLDSAYILPHLTRKPVFYLIGDSTIQSYEDCENQYGWGQFFLGCLNNGYSQKMFCTEQNHVFRYENQRNVVENHALAGRSSRSYYEQDHLKVIGDIIREGDFLFIQFGHNDLDLNRSDRYVPIEEFTDTLKRYIDWAKEKNAIPVLLTTTIPGTNLKDRNSDLFNYHKRLKHYNDETTRFAQMQNILFLPVSEVAANHFQQLSAEKIQAFYQNDAIHLTTAGALFYAELIAGLFVEAHRNMSDPKQ